MQWDRIAHFCGLSRVGRQWIGRGFWCVELVLVLRWLLHSVSGIDRSLVALLVLRGAAAFTSGCTDAVATGGLVF